MKVHCKYDKLVELKHLNPHPRNRNIHPVEQIERLSKILEDQGVRYTINVSKLSGFIVSGHGRFEAAKLLGWKKFPVSFQAFADEDQEYRALISDNAIAAWAELDLKAVNQDMKLGEIGPFDLELLGIEKFTLDAPPKIPKDKTPIECPECGAEL